MENTQIQLEQAFQDAKKWKKERTVLCGSGNSWDESKTDFEKSKCDIFLTYDQNRAPDVVTPDVENQLRVVMQTVQQQATSQFVRDGADFTRDPELWIEFFARYPLLFNFRERESKTFKKEKFSLTANAELISECLGSQTPVNIAESFIRALKKSSARVVSTSKEDEHLQYLTLVRTYDKASTLTIYRAELKLAVREVKTICAGGSDYDMFINYDRVVFEINNSLAQALYPGLVQFAAEEMVPRLTEFFKMLAKAQFEDFDRWLQSIH